MTAMLRVAFAIALVPLLSLLVLTAAGAATLPGVLWAALAVTVAALILAYIWTHDATRLEDALRGAAAGGLPPLPPRSSLSFIARAHSQAQALWQTMQTRRAQVERLLRSEEAIVECLPDPLIVLSADRLLRRANAAARAAFGDEIPSVLRHPELRAAIDRALTLSGRQIVQSAELTLPVPVKRDVLAMVVGLETPLADGGGVLVVLADRTRERAVERTRADFVANASHELRTPLASLIGFIATLRGPAADDPPAQARFLAIMAEQAERMGRVIDDLLSLSRIEIAEHQQPNEIIDLDDLVGRMLETFEIRAKSRTVKLLYTTSENPPLVPGDPDQLEQVTQNLIDNGLKYGREGGELRVSLTLAAGSPWPARPGIVLSVADDGPGIAREHLPRLTERFYRVDAGRSRAVGGTGLGLAIVKHIVNRHRGQLLIESEPGQGAKFSVWLPLATIEATPTLEGAK